jgi:hypothetical protein
MEIEFAFKQHLLQGALRPEIVHPEIMRHQTRNVNTPSAVRRYGETSRYMEKAVAYRLISFKRRLLQGTLRTEIVRLKSCAIKPATSTAFGSETLR